MKIIILLAGYGSRMRPHTWSRPKALLNVAGNTTIGHLLDLMSAMTTQPDAELIFVVGYKGRQIERWIRAHYSHLTTHFVIQKEAKGQAHAVWLCHDLVADDESVVVAFGDGIVDADYASIPADADGVILTKEVADPRSFGVVQVDEAGYIVKFTEKPDIMDHKQAIVGMNWFRQGGQLFAAIEQTIAEKRQTLGEFFMVDAYSLMLEQGAKMITKPATMWEDAGQPKNILHTNKLLLGSRFATQNALERSFTEGFTVVPPVYLHETAEINASVIGPYATINAGVKVTGSIVRNSIVEAGAEVCDCILDGALIGQNARVSSQGKKLFVGDNSQVEL